MNAVVQVTLAPGAAHQWMYGQLDRGVGLRSIEVSEIFIESCQHSCEGHATHENNMVLQVTAMVSIKVQV